MNWLMYIGGGLIWVAFWGDTLEIDNRHNIDGTQAWDVVVTICSIASWVWICWRLI